MRLDQYLVYNQTYPTRNRAQEAIKSGYIQVNGKTVVKASFEVEEGMAIHSTDTIKYVSRSGNKLAFALEKRPYDFTEKHVLDLGAAAGGFTQVALQHNASSVLCVDVGTNQLDVQLRRDPRVKTLENTDARDLTREQLDAQIDILLMDVSFISGKKILAHVLPLLTPRLTAYVLIKPQFEVGPQHVSDTGQIKNPRIVSTMLEEYKSFLRDYGVTILDLFECGFKGKEGNTEYFVVFEKTESR